MYNIDFVIVGVISFNCCYIFDMFVIGVFNWFVYVVVLVIVEVFVCVYNFLFIWGEFGFGKIYLLYVVGNYV